MSKLLLIFFFVLGTILGSFYHLVGIRRGQGKSIIKPASHCSSCNNRLKWYDLIPVISYLLNKGKCRYCHTKINFSYFLTELITGVLFAVAYHVFGLNVELIIKLIFISCLIIIIVSDIEYMIIPDEILITGCIVIVLINLIFNGLDETYACLLSAIFSFVVMLGLKMFGDFVFKKESLGGGDIKLMFLFGLVLNFDTAILSIFLATFIAFPIAIIELVRKKNNIIPFGPFLSVASIILAVTDINFNTVFNYLLK
ncbi:MAG: prepilin peptidase [bacterium]|nr:prepilin peptidase [bacterium]